MNRCRSKTKNIQQDASPNEVRPYSGRTSFGELVVAPFGALSRLAPP
jgi:hypothetical protein